MKQIPLTQGKFALVDDEDFDYLSQWKWYARKRGNTFYAARNIKSNEEKMSTLMHLYIIKKNDKNTCIDHIDGNGLNNQKENLRLCLHAENLRNRKLSKNNKSGFKGVSFNGYSWVSNIKCDRIIYLGSFKCKIQAARAYNEAAIKYHGEFAHLNQIPA